MYRAKRKSLGLYECSGMILVVTLIIAFGCGIFFNRKHHHDEMKEEKKHNKSLYKYHLREVEKQKEDVQNQKDQVEKKLSYYQEYWEHLDLEKAQKELEYYRSLRRPHWYYYDPKDDISKICPGEYGKDLPTPTPKDDEI